MALEDYSNPAVYKIAQEANKLLEAKRKKEEAKKMAKLMKNFNYDLLRGDDAVIDTQAETSLEMELDEIEVVRMQKLQGMEEEMAAGTLLNQEPCPCPKYEAPLVTKLRSVETVDELYHLADQIIPLATKQR